VRAADLGFGRSHRRFIKKGTKYLSESGVAWMSGNTQRRCDRTL
jgi:hypothetical protein